MLQVRPESIYQDMTRFEEYDWSASKEGFEDISGTLNLMNDTTVNLIMTPGTFTEDQKLQGLSVYPNPTHSKLFIESGEIIRRIDFYDLRGVLVSSKEVNDSHISFDISDYPSGTYIARVYRDGQLTTNLKIIKLKEILNG